jgi:hypothetical protein
LDTRQYRDAISTAGQRREASGSNLNPDAVAGVIGLPVFGCHLARHRNARRIAPEFHLSQAMPGQVFAHLPQYSSRVAEKLLLAMGGEVTIATDKVMIAGVSAIAL